MRFAATIAALLFVTPLAAQQDSTRPRGHAHGQCTGANCPAPGAGGGMGMGMGMVMRQGQMHGQGMGQGGGMGMMGMGGPMARTMAFAPSRLLEHKDVLALSDRQVQQLTALRALPLHPRFSAHVSRTIALLQGPPLPDAARAYVAADLEDTAGWAREVAELQRSLSYASTWSDPFWSYGWYGRPYHLRVHR